MIKSILVPLHGQADDAEALNAAHIVAQLFNGHLDCLHVRPDPRLLVANTTAGMETGLGAGVFPAELWNTLAEADQRSAKAARFHFDKFCKQFDIVRDSAPSQSVTAGFREIEGDPGRDITLNARYNDLVVFAHDSLANDASLDGRGDVILGCGRPVLLAPIKTQFTSLSTIVVAWKPTAESARAVTAAMPLLAKAKNIVVLCAGEGSDRVEDTMRSAERLVGLLHRHGFEARGEHVPAGGESPAHAIVDRALALKADLFVMGAYGHSRMREFVFGGFTRHVLSQTKLPALIAH